MLAFVYACFGGMLYIPYQGTAEDVLLGTTVETFHDRVCTLWAKRSDPVSPSIVELSVTILFSFEDICFSVGLAHTTVGRVARTNAFEVM